MKFDLSFNRQSLAPEMRESGNLLILAGVEDAVLKRLKNSEAYGLIGGESGFGAQRVIGTSLNQALAAAEKWIAEQQVLKPVDLVAPGEKGTENSDA